MKRFWSLVGTMLVWMVVTPLCAHAAYQITNDFCSPAGGVWSKEGVTTVITSSNMQPYAKLTKQDLDVLNTRGASSLAQGSDNLNAMSLYNCEGDPACGGDQRLVALLTDKNQNYLTAGFTPEYTGALSALREAIKIYSFIYTQDPTYTGALGNLKQAFNDLMSTHMVFSDEFLVDALHLRFSNMSWTMDACLAGQIALLQNAITYYKAGIDDFLSLGTEPIPGSPDVIAEVLGDDEWHTFGLLSERLSLSIRERGAKMRAMGQQTYDDPFIQEELSNSLAEMYVQASVLAAKMGAEAFESSAQFLMTAIAQLGKQVDDHKRGLTPLGYDERYVPLLEFENSSGTGIYQLAAAKATEAITKEQAILNEERQFDQQLASYAIQLNTLNTDYKTRLYSLTGCSTVLSDADFRECVLEGGDVLFLDCPLSLGVDEFNATMNALGSLGLLGDKYRQIKGADIALTQARLQHDNIAKQIENHNASVNYQIQLKKDLNAQEMEALSAYQEKMKNACTITETKERKKIRKNGEWKIEPVTKGTIKSFVIEDSQLVASIAKERDVAAATLNFEILSAQDPSVVRNLLLTQAEALVGIDAAVHNKNGMIASFHASVKEKEALLDLWEQNKAALAKYQLDDLALHRILLSDAVIAHSRKLNDLAHYSYLAAKALEYRYADRLIGISLGTKILNLTDLYKCQSAVDLDAFLDNLHDYDALWCGQIGTFDMERFYFSVAIHVLGLTNKALGDSNFDNIVDATGESVVDVRYEKFQEFVNQNIDDNGNLTFSFSTNINAFPLKNRMDNIKVWYGTIPCGADLAKGFTSSLYFRGNAGTIRHYMTITQKGNHTLLKDDEIFDCYPVNTHTLLTGSTQEPLVTQVQIYPFNEVDLSLPGSAGSGGGTWASKFANKSAAAQEWVITLNRQSIDPDSYPDMPFHKLEDIYFYFDGIGEY